MILGLVLMAVYFVRVESVVQPNPEAFVVNIYEELEEEGLYEDLPVTTATEEDSSRCNDSCR